MDPEVEEAFRRLLSTADDLEAAQVHAEQRDIAALLNEPTPVTSELMSDLAILPPRHPS